MNQQDILFLNGQDVVTLLHDRDLEVLECVSQAYQTHDQGMSNVPHSSFLRFPDMERERIIALPAYLGGDFAVAGLKWISSFPDNVERNMERASAVLILNSTETGHVKALMESSVISAKRTAASAAVAARALRGEQPTSHVRIIGCGLISFETVRFLVAAFGTLTDLTIYDLSSERMAQFSQKCQEVFPALTVHMVNSLPALLDEASVVAFATTAVKPYVEDLALTNEDAVILHTSLRDLQPSVILPADNIADDIDHAIRAQTSLHLAEQEVGHRDFVRGTIGQILNQTIPARTDDRRRVIYSPFGLGALDMAVGDMAYRLAAEQSAGTVLGSFLPAPWTERN